MQRGLGLFNGLPNVLDPTQHSADGDELSVERIGHEAGNGGFAHPRRAPQDATVRLARFKSQPQWHARAQQVLLSNDFREGVGAQPFGKGLVTQG